MKARVIALSAFACMFFNCSKKSQVLTEGVIVGWNNGYCATCGGFYINLNNDTVLNPNTYYAVNYSSSALNPVIGLYKKYYSILKPINVYIQWSSIHLTDSAIPANWIDVNYIRER